MCSCVVVVLRQDVRSLTLPGTYQEKIGELDTSLRRFSRLKQLDLSRNSITSLEGIEHLKLLENLNLYYNNIENLKELHRLRHNQSLTELDLRLNPVTRNEPDYRLFLIHMLPSLRKLDDRSVRDSERKAALVHFATDQAAEFHDRQPTAPPQPDKHPNVRAEFVKNFTPKTGALDDDDVALLDLIARTGGDLSKPRPITGSAATTAEAENYSTEQILDLERKETAHIKQVHSPPSKDGPQEQVPLDDEPEDQVVAALQKKYPNIPKVAPSPKKDYVTEDPNLKFQDEIEAYTAYKTQGNFTPHPDPASEESGPKTIKVQRKSSHPKPPMPFQQLPVSNGGTNQFNGFDQASDFRLPKKDHEDFLFKLCDLCDKYWNGSKSLHKNQKFKSLAYMLIEEMLQDSVTFHDDELENAQQRMARLAQDNVRLREQKKREMFNESRELQDTLSNARKDVEMMKGKLQKAFEDNRVLSSKLRRFESGSPSLCKAAESMTTSSDELARQNELLHHEIEVLKIRLKQFNQMQELSAMLQESHKSLVSTNEHLLKELDDSRERHQNEIEQMTWSYDQLKKTVSYLPNSTTENSSEFHNGHMNGEA
ncbi:centrosomal protein of 72 kDa-like isoform X1 [Lineus longissimus]|uniref:centrosomal protein of 72 kDa-like isoform X1 n=1 Tax=Lineus longissimus TaxID=88925 RepID=UPI00315DB5AB